MSVVERLNCYPDLKRRIAFLPVCARDPWNLGYTQYPLYGLPFKVVKITEFNKQFIVDAPLEVPISILRCPL